MSDILHEELIKLAAKEGSKAGVEAYRKEQKKAHEQLSDRRLHNVRLLLKNYRELKQHADNAVYTAEQAEDAIDILDMMWDPHNRAVATVESIKGSLLKTKIMMGHIDSMIDIYRDMVYRSNNELEIRRFNILYDRYIGDSEIKVTSLCDKYHIDKRTVYYDTDIAAERLSKLIFGIDTLDKKG